MLEEQLSKKDKLILNRELNERIEEISFHGIKRVLSKISGISEPDICKFTDLRYLDYARSSKTYLKIVTTVEILEESVKRGVKFKRNLVKLWPELRREYIRRLPIVSRNLEERNLYEEPQELDTKIEDIDYRTQMRAPVIRNLKLAGCKTLRDVMNLTPEEMKETKFMGEEFIRKILAITRIQKNLTERQNKPKRIAEVIDKDRIQRTKELVQNPKTAISMSQNMDELTTALKKLQEVLKGFK